MKWFSEQLKSRSRDVETSQSSDSSCDTSSETEPHNHTKRGRSSSTDQMDSSTYYRRSAERTYYSPNYCPWSRSSSSESDSVKLTYRSIKSKKSNALLLKSVSNCNRNTHTPKCISESIRIQSIYTLALTHILCFILLCRLIAKKICRLIRLRIYVNLVWSMSVLKFIKSNAKSFKIKFIDRPLRKKKEKNYFVANINWTIAPSRDFF